MLINHNSRDWPPIFGAAIRAHIHFCPTLESNYSVRKNGTVKFSWTSPHDRYTQKIWSLHLIAHYAWKSLSAKFCPFLLLYAFFTNIFLAYKYLYSWYSDYLRSMISSLIFRQFVYHERCSTILRYQKSNFYSWRKDVMNVKFPDTISQFY